MDLKNAVSPNSRTKVHRIPDVAIQSLHDKLLRWINGRQRASALCREIPNAPNQNCGAHQHEYQAHDMQRGPGSDDAGAAS